GNCAQEFLSTPSVGRATPAPLAGDGDPIHFYPRPPWGGRLINAVSTAQKTLFLSTPSVGRATESCYESCKFTHKFLSTPSVGRATRPPGKHRRQNADFYPRPPWGGRRPRCRPPCPGRK